MTKNDFNASILEKSLKNNSRFILPESEDERVIKAIEILIDLGFTPIKVFIILTLVSMMLSLIGGLIYFNFGSLHALISYIFFFIL